MIRGSGANLLSMLEFEADTALKENLVCPRTEKSAIFSLIMILYLDRR